MKASPLHDRISALADPIRTRLLLLLERHELTVTELRAVLQAPQSTVSRHLKVLADADWVDSREDGTSNRYRLDVKSLDVGSRKLWAAVRDEASSSPTARRDAERVKGVLAERHTRSQAFFVNAAAQWDRMRAELFGPRTELFALAGLLEPSFVVGDLGCGTGQLSEVIAPFVHEVIAVDESAPMLKAARARLASRENVALREGSLEALPVADGALDLAVLSLVLHFVAEPVDALTEIRRVLRPGTGRLLLLDMLPHDHEEYQQTMGHVWLGISSDQLQQWSDAAGFRAVRYHALPAATQVKGPMLFAAVLQV